MTESGLDWNSLVAFDNVAAGHDGVMSDASGSLIIKPCVAAEVQFYEVSNAEHPEFAQLMPTFMGSLQHEANNPLRGKKLDTGLAIVLENVLAGFQKPNFVDVKLGKRLWADDAPLSKRNKLDDVASQTTSGSLGFRIAGMKVWQPEGSGEYKVFDKFYGRTLTSDNVRNAFSTFLCVDQKTETSDIVEDVISNIEEAVGAIEQIIAKQESRMYSASLLFVYEGDPQARKEALDSAVTQTEQSRHSDDRRQEGENVAEDEDDEEDEQAEPKLFDIKLIDFAHAEWTPGQGPDENMLMGIRNVRRVLRDLMKEVSHE
ncbi:SAICAR synthase-like protein [Aureobasidium namibiae CBS 147.97]|uniref:Kinase n=1 Tax=Aureobasidium namibiae CBS 147.97 TaxID=1043004 RepID=A0A074WJI0_9PEZI|nr:SAICAR synthase-like protein [Aureobasidium namibiae CBS 147.97]KEQ71769.1 SAICAR synthase-like protein [Aureobasidium namibiae CBS 147.97]